MALPWGVVVALVQHCSQKGTGRCMSASRRLLRDCQSVAAHPYHILGGSEVVTTQS